MDLTAGTLIGIARVKSAVISAIDRANAGFSATHATPLTPCISNPFNRSGGG